MKYIHDFFNFKGVTHSGIIVTIAQLALARVAQIIFPRNPAATICVVPNNSYSHLVTLKLAQSLLPLASAIFAARGENFVYPSI